MKKISLILLASFMLFTSRAYADTSYQAPCGAYGQAPCPITTTFTVQKEVQKPTKGGEFIKNITQADPKFAPGQTVNFRITVQNNGTSSLSSVDLTDVFPQFLNFTTGVGGTFDPKTKVLKFSFNDIKPGESKQVIISVQVDSADKLPKDQGVVCVTNQVTAVSGGTQAQDSSQVCIEKQVLGVQPTVPIKQTPPTGPEMAVLPLLGSMGAFGVFLRRKSRLN